MSSAQGVGGAREELGEGAALHVLGHDADHRGLVGGGHHGPVEAQDVGVVEAGQHVCLPPERRAVARHLARLHAHRNIRALSRQKECCFMENITKRILTEFSLEEC